MLNYTLTPTEHFCTTSSHSSKQSSASPPPAPSPSPPTPPPPKSSRKSAKAPPSPALIPDRPPMILPAVRERLETLLRQPAVEGAIAALRSGSQHISLSGLHDVAKAFIAAYITHELRRPAFFVTDS